MIDENLVPDSQSSFLVVVGGKRISVAVHEGRNQANQVGIVGVEGVVAEPDNCKVDVKVAVDCSVGRSSG